MKIRRSFGMVGLLVLVTVLSGPLGAAAQTMSSNTLNLALNWLLPYGAAKAFKPMLVETSLLARFEKVTTVQLLAKAQPDEFFYSIAKKNTLPWNPAIPKNPGDRTNKVNQAYIWGMTKVANKIWFGTAANVNCLVQGNYFDTTGTSSNWNEICEYGRSWYSSALVTNGMHLPAKIGDWRSPNIFCYDTASNSLTRIDTLLPPEGSNLVWKTLGFRAAGSSKGVVILGGPSTVSNGGINLFAFSAASGAFLACTNLPQYGNIRKFAVVNGIMYTTVGAEGEGAADFAPGGGWVLRWLDDPTTPGYPLAFQEVGRLDGGGAEICANEGRLFVGTWPSLRTTNMYDFADSTLAGLWMSPPIPADGLRPVHTGLWEKVWQADDYEPDPIIAKTYGCGAMAVYGGYLYWGTMHVPLTAYGATYLTYGSKTLGATNSDGVTALQLGTTRAPALFRGNNFAGGGAPNIQLLYGNNKLPVFDAQALQWQVVNNNMGAIPRMGLAGFGNLYNAYIWSMAVYKNSLYVGTYDQSDIGSNQLAMSQSNTNIINMLAGYLTNGTINISALNNVEKELESPGADLYCFSSANTPAIAISKWGMGNWANYGIRNMIGDSSGLYLGTANPRNMLSLTNSWYPLGGWELIGIGTKKIVVNKDTTTAAPPKGTTTQKATFPTLKTIR